MKNLASLHDFIDTYNFATLISQSTNQDLNISHIPVTLNRSLGKQGTLAWHVARKNPQAYDFDGVKKALFIFHGPHAYISPRWYKSFPAVPTWNYAVVRVHGTPKKIVNEQLSQDLSRLMIQHEGNSTYQIPEDYKTLLMDHIVGFNMEITKIESTFKLGQNRSQADQEGMLAALTQQQDPAAKALAELMQELQKSENEIVE